MCNKDDLVSYLYEELDGASRAAFERHLRTCGACRDELDAMRSVRADLVTWTPPMPEFAFRLVAEPRQAEGKLLRPGVASWRAWFTPAAGFAAAAVLVLAAAAGLAHIEVHTGADGLTVRTGWSASPSSPGEASPASDGGHARDVNLALPLDANLASLERRIAALETAAHDSGTRNASALSARANNEELLKVVRDLLAQSETRQKGELALRIAQVIRDVDAQRVADLNRVQQGIGRIDATVADEAAAHRELMNYILTSSKSR